MVEVDRNGLVGRHSLLRCSVFQSSDAKRRPAPP
jgi:hypothetical protein